MIEIMFKRQFRKKLLVLIFSVILINLKSFLLFTVWLEIVLIDLF